LALLADWLLLPLVAPDDLQASTPAPVRLMQLPSTKEPPLISPNPVPPPPVQPFVQQPMVSPTGPVFGSPYQPDPPTPVVSIKVRVPAVSAPGKELEYRICVKNTSPAPAHHVLVRAPLPVNARFVKALPDPTAVEPEVQWLFGTLPPGVCKEIVLVLAPTG